MAKVWISGEPGLAAQVDIGDGAVGGAEIDADEVLGHECIIDEDGGI
jgi:hypothetical protein